MLGRLLAGLLCALLLAGGALAVTADNIQFQTGDGELLVTWTGGEAEDVSFEITAANADGDATATATQTGSGSLMQAALTGLTNDVPYSVVVTDVDNGQESDPASPVVPTAFFEAAVAFLGLCGSDACPLFVDGGLLAATAFGATASSATVQASMDDGGTIGTLGTTSFSAGQDAPVVVGLLTTPPTNGGSLGWVEEIVGAVSLSGVLASRQDAAFMFAAGAANGETLEVRGTQLTSTKTGAFVVGLSDSQQWLAGFYCDGSGGMAVRGLASSAAGDAVVVVGECHGSLLDAADDSELAADAAGDGSSKQAFAIKLDSADGKVVWAQLLASGAGEASAASVYEGDGGAFMLAGEFTDTLSFFSGVVEITSEGGSDAWFALVDDNGSPTAVGVLRGDGTEALNDVGGSFLLTGSSSSSTLAGTAYASDGSSSNLFSFDNDGDAGSTINFLVSLDDTLGFVFGTAVSGAVTNLRAGADAHGDVLLHGVVGDGEAMEGVNVQGASHLVLADGQQRPFVAKYGPDSAGQGVWLESWGIDTEVSALVSLSPVTGDYLPVACGRQTSSSSSLRGGFLGSANTAEVFVAWARLTGIPSAPKSVSAEIASGTIDLAVTWEASEFDNGAAIDSYTVSYGDGNSANVATGEDLTYVLESDAEYGTYEFSVTANNAEGASWFRTSDEIVFGLPVPDDSQSIVVANGTSPRVNITGSFFGRSAGDAVDEVHLMGEVCEDLEWLSATKVQCTAKLADLDPGVGPVTVVREDIGQSSTSVDVVEILAGPAIEALDARAVAHGSSSASLTIAGTGFGVIDAAAAQGVTVTSDSNAALVEECVMTLRTALAIACTFDPSALDAGVAWVEVVDALGKPSPPDFATTAIEVQATPTVVSIAPSTLPVDGSVDMTITGTGFGVIAATKPSAVTVAGVLATAVTWVSETEVVVTPPSVSVTLGDVADVVLINAAGEESEAAAGAVLFADVPGTVNSLAVAALDQGAQVSWSTPDDNGAAVSGYTVDVALGGAVVATYGTTGVSLEVPDLVNGYAYEFEVYATNAVGDGATVGATATPLGSVSVSASLSQAEVGTDVVNVTVTLSSAPESPLVVEVEDSADSSTFDPAVLSFTAAGGLSSSLLLTPGKAGVHTLTVNISGAAAFQFEAGDDAAFSGTCIVPFAGDYCDECDPQFYRDESTAECLECPTGATCDGGTDYPVPDKGYWSNSPGVVELCLPTAACQGGYGADTCSAGYTAVRCSACATEYYRAGSTCEPCPSFSLGPLLAVALALTLLIVVVFLRFAQHATTISAVAPGLGICIDFIQVLSVFSSYTFWPSTVSSTLSVFTAANFNVDYLGVECAGMSYSERWALTLSLPLLVGFLLLPMAGLGVYLQALFAHKGKDRITSVRQIFNRGDFDPVISLGLLLLQLMFMVLVTKTLEVFDCVTQTGGGSVMETLPEQYCAPPFGTDTPAGEDTSTHAKLAGVGAVACVVYIAGIPTLFWQLLYRHSAEIDELADKAESELSAGAKQTRKRYGVLFTRFREGDYARHWLIFILARKFAVAFAQSMFSYNAAFQLAVMSMVIVISLVLQVRHRPYKSVEEQRRVSTRKAGFVDLNAIEEAQLSASFGVLLAGLTFQSAAFGNSWKHVLLTIVTVGLMIGAVVYIFVVAALQVVQVTVAINGAKSEALRVMALAAGKLGVSSSNLVRVHPGASSLEGSPRAEHHQTELRQAEERLNELESLLSEQQGVVQRLRSSSQC